MSYLTSIARLSQADNLGGILTIQVARKVDIESMSDPVDGVVFGDITFFPGAGFVTWEVTGESPNANSRSRTSREGASKDNRLSFTVPKDRPELRRMFERAEEDELVVLYKYANGKQRIFGLLDAPVQFRFDHESGGSHSDLNHYRCEFYYDGPDNMFEYNGLISAAPAGAAPAVVKYNGVSIASLSPGEVLNITSEFGLTNFYVTS
jgi:hypothetical protein